MNIKAIVGGKKNTRKAKRSILILLLMAMGIMCLFFNSQVSEVYASGGDPVMEDPTEPPSVEEPGENPSAEEPGAGNPEPSAAPSEPGAGNPDPGEAPPENPEPGDGSSSNPEPQGSPSTGGASDSDGDETSQEPPVDASGNDPSSGEGMPNPEGNSTPDEGDTPNSTPDEGDMPNPEGEANPAEEESPGEPTPEASGEADPEASGETDPAQDTPDENLVDPYGTVYDAITKQAIKDATVTLCQLDGTESAVYTTESNGYYEFDVKPDQIYKIIVSAYDYEGYEWLFWQGETEHIIDFYLASIASGISSGWASVDNIVTINHDIYTNGHDLNIKAPGGGGNEKPFDSIIVGNGVTISTRKLASEEGNHETDASDGNSGNITMSAINITIGKNSKILAHVNEDQTTYTAGDIILKARSGAGTDALDIFVANVDHPKTSITVGSGVLIKGGAVNFTAESNCNHILIPEDEDIEVEEGDSEEDIKAKLELAGILELGENLAKELGQTVHKSLEGFNLIGGVAISRATSIIEIGVGSVIEAYSFDAKSEALINATAKPIAIGVAVAVAIGASDAQVILNGTIKTTENCTINALADNTMVAVGNSTGIAGFGAGAAVNILYSKSTVQAGDSAAFYVGGNLSLIAKTVDRTYTRASSAMADNGKVGVAVAVGIEDGITAVTLGGIAYVTGDVNVEALMEEEILKGSEFFGLLDTEISGVNAVAGVNMISNENISSDAQKAINNEIMTKFMENSAVKDAKEIIISSFKKADEKTDDKAETPKSFPVNIAAAVGFYQDTNRVMACIADDAIVKSQGDINVHAQAKSKPALLSIGVAKSPAEDGGGSGGGAGGGSSGGGGGTGDGEDSGAAFSGSAAVAVGIFTNEVTAYIGQRAQVDAAKDLTVEAEYINDYELKYGVELIECLTEEYYNSQQTDKTIKKDDIVEVLEGHEEEKGEVGNLYKYLGADSLSNADLSSIDYTNTELWEDLGSDWSYRQANLLNKLATNYLNKDMGLSKIPNFWTQSSASEGKVGVSGSVSVIVSDNAVKAYIGENAKINQDTETNPRNGSQNVKVISKIVDETVTFSGNIILPGVNINKKTFDFNFQVGGKGTEAETAAVGASVVVYLQENESRAEIRDGVKLFADKLDVTADTKTLNVVVAAAGGEGGKFALEGTITFVELDNTTVAWVSNEATLLVVNDLTIKARDNSFIVNGAGALAESNNIGIGASIGLTVVSRSTKAMVDSKDSVGYQAGESTPIIGKITLTDGNLIIEALNDGFIISASLAGTVVEKEKPKAGAAKKAPKKGEEGGNYGVGISANVSINIVQDEVMAAIRQAAIEAKSTRISSKNYTQVIAVGGTVAIVTKDGTSAALAGAYAQNTITNINKAIIDDSKLTLSEDLDIEADSNEKIIAVSASGSGSTSKDGVSVAGQVSVNIISHLTEALVLNKSEIVARDVTITAADKSSILAIAGALAYGGKGGVGASVAWNQITSAKEDDAAAITAGIKDSDINASGEISLNALSDNNILAVTAAIGASNEGMAAALAISMNHIASDTQAYIVAKKSQGVEAAGAITLEAINRSSILSVAGDFSYAKTASIGVAGAYNEISGSIKAFIDEGKVKASSLSLQALSEASILSVSAGGSVSSGQAAINGSISINTITNDLATYITNSTVKVNNSITLLAKDKSEIISIAGAVGASESVAVGASLAVNYIGSFGGLGEPKYVYSYIENSRVEVENGGITISALSESHIKSVSAAGGGSSNTAVFGSVSLNFINTDIVAYIKDCTSSESTEKFVKASGDISLYANDKSTIYVAAGNVAGAGTAGVGAAIAISYIGNGDLSSFDKYINNRQYDESEPGANYEVKDGDYEYDNPAFIETSKVRVYIENSNVESTAGKLTQKAIAENSIMSISAGTAIGGTAGVQGSVTVNYLYSNVWAQILNSAVTAQEDIVLEALSKTSSIQSLAGTVSGGGVAGVGISLAVNHMANSYLANIENSTVTSGTKGVALKAFNNATISSLSASGGGGQVGVNGSVAINSINNQVLAYIVSSTVKAYQDIELLAYDYAAIGSIVGTIAGGYYAAVGASVAVNYIGTNGNPQLVEAYILNSDVKSMEGGISIIADSNSIIKSISAAGGGALVGVNGAVSVNWIYTNTAAFIKNCVDDKSVVAKGDIRVDAVDRSSISVIAGSISGGGLGAGASVAIVFIGNGELENGDPAKNNQKYENDGDDFTYNQPDFSDNSKVMAFIENSKVESINGSVIITAKDNTAIFNISAGVAAGGTGLQGSVSVNYINTGISAYIDKGDVKAKNDIIIQALTEARDSIPKSALQVESEAGDVNSFDGGAENTGNEDKLTTSKNSPEKLTNIQSVAGSVAGGGLNSAGIAIAVNIIENSYNAFVKDSILEAGNNIIIETDNLAGIESVSAAAAAAGDTKVGSVSFNLIINDIFAYTTSSDLTAGNIKILASDKSTIKSVSGQVNFSGTQGLGAAAAYNQISNTIKAYVDKDSALAKPVLTAGNNIEIQSLSAATISTIGASGSLGTGVAGSATVIINIITNTVSAYIADADVTAGNNIYILAQSLNETNSYGGSVGGGGAVGVGAAAIINVLTNDTEAYIVRSIVIASGLGDASSIPNWNEDGEKLADQTANGLFIIAYNKEAITVYSVSLGVTAGASGFAGISGQISTNIIVNTTEAFIDSSTINNDTDKGKLVILKAIQDSGLQIFAGSLAVGFPATGGAAIGGAVDATVINNKTRAYIKDSTLYAGSGVEVMAITGLKPLTDNKPSLIIAGAALSNMVSLAGAVSVVVTENTNEAFIQNSDIYSLGYTKVLSSHNIKMEVYAGTASASTFVGGGGTVIVSSFTNSSLAEIRGSDLNAAGAIEILARSRDDISLLVGTAGVGLTGAGVAGAVSVILVDTRTEASVISFIINENESRISKLNQDSRFKPGGEYAPTNASYQLIIIRADNKTETKTLAGALGAGLAAGVGAGLDYTSIQNRTVAMIGLACKIYAAGDITIEALSKKIVDSQVYSAGGGLIGISGAVSIVTVGTPISQEAKDEFNPDLIDQIDNDTSHNSWLYYKDDEGNVISRLPGDGLATAATQKIEAANGPNLGVGLSPSLDTSLKITAAFVEEAANEADRAEIAAGGNINIHALNKNNLSAKADNTVAGAIAAGGTVAYVFAGDNTHAYLGKYGYLRAENLVIKAEAFVTVSALGKAVAASLIGVNAYVAYAEVVPVTTAYIDNYANVAVVKNVQIDAETTPQVNAEIVSITGSVGTAGASFATALLEPIVKAYIGDNVHVVAASLPVSGEPELILINQAVLMDNPNLDFRGYTIQIEGVFEFVRGVVMSGAEELVFNKDNRTITRKEGSWVTEGFSVGDTIVVAGSRRNNGEYEIKTISENGKVLTLADGTVLKNETYDGQTKSETLTGNYIFKITYGGEGETQTTTMFIEGNMGDWREEGFRVGEEIGITAKISIPIFPYSVDAEYLFRISAIEGNKLIVITDDDWIPANNSPVEFITHIYVPDEISIIAKGKEYDKLIYKGDDEGWAKENSRGDILYNATYKEKNYIVIYTELSDPSKPWILGTNSGVYQIIDLEADGKTAILNTIGQVFAGTHYANLYRIIPSEITREYGNWNEDGFVAGQTIYISGADNPANNGYFDILEISDDGKTLLLSRGMELADEESTNGAVSIKSTDQNMLVRDEGLWVDEGFKLGQAIRLTGSRLGNDGVYTIIAVSNNGKVLYLAGDKDFVKEQDNRKLSVTIEGQEEDQSGQLEKYESSISISAQILLPQGGTGVTAQAKAEGVSGAFLASINGSFANVAVNPTLEAYVGSNSLLDIEGDLEIIAIALTKQTAEVDTTNVGTLAITANNAFVSSSSKINAFVGEKTRIYALDFVLKAYGEEKNFAKAKTGSGGLASGAITKAETKSETQTLASIGEDAHVEGRIVAIFAEHRADYNSQVNTFAVTLVGGGGSLAENTVAADVKIQVSDEAEINANDILLAITNYSLKDWLSGDDYNVKARAGAAANISVAKSQTFINHLTNILIEAAKLNVIGDLLFPGSLTIDAKNIIIAKDKVNLETDVGIGWARADSIIEAGNGENGGVGHNVAGINIGPGANLTSIGDINLSALTLADVETLTKIKTTGGAPGADGKSLARADVENRIDIGGHGDASSTNLYADGKINILLGQDIFDGANSISVIASTNIDNGGLAPIYSDPDVDGIINLNNFIIINSDAKLQSISDTNLLIERGVTIASGKGEGIDWIRSALGAEIKIFNSTINMNPTIKVDGTIEVGINCEQLLEIGADGEIVTISDGITVTREKEILANHIMDEINMLKSLAIEYAGTEAGEAFNAQVRFLEWELKQMGYDLSDGKPLPIEWIDIIIVGHIKAEQANLNILAEDGSLIGTGTLNASTKSPKIEIINHSTAYLKLNSLIIPEGQGGMLIFNNVAVSGENSAQINSQLNQWNKTKEAAFIANTLSSSSVNPSIVVKNTNPGTAGQRAPDIQLLGPVQNIGSPGNPGTVWIESLGGIAAYSSLDTGDLHIQAGNNFVQSYTDSFLNVGGSPRAHMDGFTRIIQGRTLPYPYYQTVNMTTYKIEWVKSTIYDTYINEALAEPTEGIIRADNIFIAARYLNINGTIEAGSANRVITLGATQESLINLYKPLTSNGNKDYDYKNYPLGNSCYYDPNTGAIIIEPIAVRGGYIELFGQIINTNEGQGKIISLDGYGEIKVNNNTNYDIVIKGLDTGIAIAGVVIITDTSKKKPGTENVYLTTKYERNRNNNKIEITTWYTDNRNDVTSLNPVLGREASYNPTEGYRFEWVMGQRMVERRIETYRSKSWLGVDWLAKDPDDLFYTHSWKDGAPVLMPEGEYLVYRPGSNAAGTAYANIPYLYWYEYKEDTTEKQIGHRSWSEQSWFLAPVWYYDEYVFQKGYIEVYYHSIKADYPIAIEFIGGDSGKVEVNSSNGNVIIDGSIRNSSGKVTITTGKEIKSNIDLAIVANEIILKAETGIGFGLPIGVELKGGVITAETESGDISIREMAGNLTAGIVKSKTGNVKLEAVNDIKASSITGNLVELLSRYGVIYGTNSNDTLRINTGNEKGQGLIAQARGDINLRYFDDLRIISIVSDEGDINIYSVYYGDPLYGFSKAGNIIDGKGEYLGNADLLALWPEKENNIYTAREIQEFLEYAHLQQISDTNYWTRLPNIIGRNINFTVENAAIGEEEAWRIDLEDGQVTLTAEMATILAGAMPVGVLFYDSSDKQIYDLNNNTAAYMIVTLKRALTVEASGVIKVQGYGHVYLDSAQDLRIEKIHTSSHGVRIRTKENIYNASTDGNGYIRGATIFLEASNGSVGTDTAPIVIVQTNPGFGRLTARAGDAIYLSSIVSESFNGDLYIDYIYAPNLVNLQAVGAIRDIRKDSGDNVATHNLTLTAQSVGASTRLLGVNLLIKDGGTAGLINTTGVTGECYLKYSNTVTFDANGGTVTMTNKSLANAETYGDLPTPIRPGFTFTGWFTEGIGGTEIFATTAVTIDGAHTIFAHWTAKGYTVSFDANFTGGTNPADKSVAYDGSYGALPTLGDRLGYSFLGWFTAAAGGTEVTAGAIVATADDHTLYARWAANEYTVEFNANGGTVDPQSKSVSYDSSYGSLPTPIRPGYKFDGWFTEVSEGVQVKADSKVGIVANQTLYAHWTAREYLVTLDANGGTMTRASKYVTYGNAYGQLIEATRIGYTFAGWFTEASGGSHVDANTEVAIASAHTLYAQWTANTYEVTFDAQGGQVTPVGIIVTYDSDYSDLPTPTRTGYSFDGWFTKASGGDQVKTDSIVEIVENQTLYAQWTANNYTVTLDPQGGQITPVTITVTYDNSYSDLSTPIRTGYTFVGWFTTSGGGIEITTDTIVKITEDQTLYGRWTANEYQVSFDGQGGTVSPDTITVTYDEKYGDLPTPTRKGYDFTGWFTTETGGTEVVANSDVKIVDTQILYAQWTVQALAGQVIIAGSGKFGETLTADTSGISNNSGTLSYQWKRDGQDIDGAKSASYTLVTEDIGKIISCEVTSNEQTGFLNCTSGGIVLKADGLAVTGVSKTNCTTSANNNGTLVGVTGAMEYRLVTDEDETQGVYEWISGDGSIIMGLIKGSYIVRMKETATHTLGPEATFIIAAYRSSGGGGGGGATLPAESPVPISGGGQEKPLIVDVSGDTANVGSLGDAELQEILEAAGAAAESVALDLSAIDDLVDTVVVPGGLVIGVAQSAGTGLDITMPDGKSVNFDKIALESLAAADSGDLRLMVRTVATDTLTDRERRLVGSNATVIDLTAYVGEKQVSDFGGGFVTVSIPVIGQPVEHPIVWRMITDADGKVRLEAVECTYNPETNSYQFKTGSFSKYVVSNYPFIDTPDGSWYYANAVYAYVNGLFSGMSDTTFSPDLAMTRAMLVTVLWRMEGNPNLSESAGSSKAASFRDVDQGSYYAKAVAWAEEKRIVSGYGNGKFGPEDAISREQMAVILMNYARYKGFYVSAIADLSTYEDANGISSWARDAMTWANAEGLIQGSGSKLTPTANATRAQVAAILNRFIESDTK